MLLQGYVSCGNQVFIMMSLLDPLVSVLPIIVKQTSPSIIIVRLLTGNVSKG